MDCETTGCLAGTELQIYLAAQLGNSYNEGDSPFDHTNKALLCVQKKGWIKVIQIMLCDHFNSQAPLRTGSHNVLNQHHGTAIGKTGISV